MSELGERSRPKRWSVGQKRRYEDPAERVRLAVAMRASLRNRITLAPAEEAEYLRLVKILISPDFQAPSDAV
jgi:hypothetical protein